MGTDNEIRNRFRVRSGDTLPHKTHNCTRETLAKFMGDMAFQAGAEIGVAKGDFSLVLCSYIPNLKLKLIDPWDTFGRRTTRESNEKNLQRAMNRLKGFPNCEFIRKGSLDAVKDVPDNSLDFVYIDEMHEFDPVMMDLIQWSPKVRSGGIVSGHDYSNVFYQFGVIQAVHSYTYIHNIYNWYITSDDVHPSFFWVK